MSMGRMWAGWRREYVEGVANNDPDSGCVFCDLSSNENSFQIITSNDSTMAVINIHPYTSGHLLVMPRRHVSALDALNSEEAGSVMMMTQAATTAITSAYEPDGINVGINQGSAAGAGLPNHLHVHVLPRWIADTNFMTAVAQVRVLPEALDVTCERLRSAWPANSR